VTSPGEAREALGRLRGILGGDPQSGQCPRAVRMIEKAIAPDERLGVVRQELHATFVHAAMRDARNREARIIAAAFRCNGPAHIDERQGRETGSGETAMFCGGIGAAEGGEVQTDMIVDAFAQLARQLGLGRCCQELDIAFAQHRAAITGAGRHRLAVDAVRLRRERRQAKAAAFQRGRGAIHVGHEMRDMVEENGAGPRQLLRHSRSSR
jgi:hypothetical protein